jgi:hypothetical protein
MKGKGHEVSTFQDVQHMGGMVEALVSEIAGFVSSGGKGSTRRAFMNESKGTGGGGEFSPRTQEACNCSPSYITYSRDGHKARGRDRDMSPVGEQPRCEVGLSTGDFGDEELMEPDKICSVQ